MRVVDIILAKRHGEEIEESALEWLVQGYTRGDVPDYQMAAFLMAVVFQGMRPREMRTWVHAMLHSGVVLDLSEIPGAKVDKHSTGGVGDKVSLILAPLAMAAGVKVPMISGRGLGHTGGTLDKLESIPGFDTRLPISRYRELVEDIGGCLIGQTEEIAPADKKLYALRDVTGTVRCIPLITGSIMSKKMAEGIDSLVLDIKVGNGAFMKSLEEARELTQAMVDVGRELGRPVHALLTNMNQPLGEYVGNSLEVIESVEVLKGRGPKDLIDITVALTTEMVVLARGGGEREAIAQELLGYLSDGSALEAFRKLVVAQGGDARVLEDYDVLPRAAHKVDVVAARSGYIGVMQTTEIGIAGVELGGGRLVKEDDIDPGVGFVFHKRTGDAVAAGEPIVTIHYNDVARLEACRARLEPAVPVEDEPGGLGPLIYERVV